MIRRRFSIHPAEIALAAFALITPFSGESATVWNGPLITFTKTNFANLALPANQDRLTPNVWITRGSSQGPFNVVLEASFRHSLSPSHTEWASGALANYASLTYVNWDTWAKIINGGPPFTVGVDAVVHLIDDDVYLSVKFVSWTEGANGGGFSYLRSTPGSTVSPPSVSITNPAGGAIFSAPADLRLFAEASASGGTVTNLLFLTNSIALGSVQAAPFSLTASNLAPGSYALAAVATASGLSATSSIVNISIISPSAVSMSSVTVTNGLFSFVYNANAGLSYVVQKSSDLINWANVTTNVAAVDTVLFSEGVSNVARFYRVGRLPNP